MWLKQLCNHVIEAFRDSRGYFCCCLECVGNDLPDFLNSCFFTHFSFVPLYSDFTTVFIIYALPNSIPPPLLLRSKWGDTIIILITPTVARGKGQHDAHSSIFIILRLSAAEVVKLMMQSVKARVHPSVFMSSNQELLHIKSMWFPANAKRREKKWHFHR